MAPLGRPGKGWSVKRKFLVMPLNSRICFDPAALLTLEGTARIRVAKSDVIFRQGDDANAVFYVEQGAVTLFHRASSDKDKFVALLKAGDFLGLGCVAGQPKQKLTATAEVPSSVIRIEKITTIRMLYQDPQLTDLFVSFFVDLESTIRQKTD